MRWICLLILFSTGHNILAAELDWLDRHGVEFRLIEGGTVGRSPLVKGARIERNMLLDEFPIYTFSFSKTVPRLIKDVQKRDGEVRCDCGEFVQVAAYLLAHPRKRTVILPTAQNFPEAVACACNVDLYYLRLANNVIHHSMQRTAFLNKGTWLLKVGENQYLGLGTDGPKVLSIQRWSNRLRKGLLCELELGYVTDSQAEFVRLLSEEGMIKRWSLDHFSSEWPEPHREDMQRIMTRVRRVP